MSNRNHCLDQKQYDGDTLLHIVTSNRDYGKIYALSELLLKNDMVCSANPIDVRNDQNETPLFKAVEYRCRPEAIEYFLALGADPNVQPMQSGKPIKDPPLHYAASHSMPEIVEVKCINEFLYPVYTVQSTVNELVVTVFSNQEKFIIFLILLGTV